MDINKFIELDQSKKIKVFIVGDAMLDEYYQVSVNRLSPEYPIPVELSSNDCPDLVLPGGAANVAYQMKHCGADVTLFSFMDRVALEYLENYNFSIERTILKSGTMMIPRKRRFYDGVFPLRRWDVESHNGSPEDRRNLYKSLESHFKKERPDVVILSDYNKGVFNYSSQVEPYFSQKVINLCLLHNVPTIVDPKGGPIEQWQGCRLFKLNAKEANDYSGKSDWREQLHWLHNALVQPNPQPLHHNPRTHQVIITQGGEGVVGFNEKDYPKDPYWKYVNPDCASDETRYDEDAACVIGAGDCFAAYYANAYARGYSLADAAEIAYSAGAAYVRQRHNEPVRPRQLLGDKQAKFMPVSELAVRDFSVAVSNGCFDILHPGHIKTLEFSKSKADKLIVAVNTDRSVAELKGDSRPINSLKHRMSMLASLECVDYVVSFDSEDELYSLIKNIRPEALIKGGDYKVEDVLGSDIANETFIVPLEEGWSTTDLIEKVKDEADCT